VDDRGKDLVGAEGENFRFLKEKISVAQGTCCGTHFRLADEADPLQRSNAQIGVRLGVDESQQDSDEIPHWLIGSSTAAMAATT
jgi:hypothetical protein